MKSKLFITLSFVLLWSCNQKSSESGHSDIISEVNTPLSMAQYVSLDQAYIPVLFFTSIEDLDASRASHLALQEEWEIFKDKIFKDPEWDNGVKEIDQHIKSAESFITTGQNLKEAHQELEHVREILLNLRRRNNIEYFVDHLTTFHESMEEIVLTAKQTSLKKWTTETTTKIQSILPEAETRWKRVQKAPFDPNQYQFDEQQFYKMKQFIEVETQALEMLKNNLDQKVPIPVLRASALEIKKYFAEIFKLFGNLEPYQEVPLENSVEPNK